MTLVNTRNILFICGGAFPGLTDIDSRYFRITIGFGIGLVQKSHAVYTVLTGFQCQSNQIVNC